MIKFLDSIYAPFHNSCSCINTSNCYWFPGQEYLLAFVSSWKEAEPHICMRSCNTSIFFSWKLFSEHPFYETALSYSSYPQIGWNEYQGHSVEILGHTLLWTGRYENNHVDWGSLTAGLSRLADQQEQHSIEMSTDNYNKGTYILHNTNSTKRMWEGTVVKAEMVAHNVWWHDVLWRCSKINQTWDISKCKPLEISLPPVPWTAWIIKMVDMFYAVYNTGKLIYEY